MVPTAMVEAVVSKPVGWPATAGVTESWATGAWSGVMARKYGKESSVIGVSAVLVAVLIGVRVAAHAPAT